MDGVYDSLLGVFGDRSAIMLTLLVFLATTTVAFGVMATVHARGAGQAPRRRDRRALGRRQRDRALRASSLKAVQRLLDYTTSTIRRATKTKAR